MSLERAQVSGRRGVERVNGGVCRVLRTFNGGIVLIDEMALDELYCEAALSHTSTADDNKLVFPEELRQRVSMGGCANGRTKRTFDAISEEAGLRYSKW